MVGGTRPNQLLGAAGSRHSKAMVFRCVGGQRLKIHLSRKKSTVWRPPRRVVDVIITHNQGFQHCLQLFVCSDNENIIPARAVTSNFALKLRNNAEKVHDNHDDPYLVEAIFGGKSKLEKTTTLIVFHELARMHDFASNLTTLTSPPPQ